MKTRIRKFVSLGLFITILVASPEFLFAQNGNGDRLFGELTVTSNASSASGEYVTVDRQPVPSGRSIMSPSEIVTSAQTSAKVLFAQTGSVSISPNTRINLTFVNSSIAGDLGAGEIIVETVPNTAINIFTIDGGITTPNRNQKNVVKISIINGVTQVTTLTGQVMFNKVLVSGGETYPQTTNDKTTDSGSSKGGISPAVIVGIVGAVAGVALVALLISSGNKDNPTVSPIR
jgi:hypothetical protein